MGKVDKISVTLTDEQAAATLRQLVAEADASGHSQPWEGGNALKRRFQAKRDGHDG
ncbi:MAG: hypothetical protein IT551_11770 [Novosphingobium sp.]|jgi:hypothetical protein|nr:hypothetical protein [Novosphingobium sp.]